MLVSAIGSAQYNIGSTAKTNFGYTSTVNVLALQSSTMLEPVKRFRITKPILEFLKKQNKPLTPNQRILLVGKCDHAICWWRTAAEYKCCPNFIADMRIKHYKNVLGKLAENI